MESPAPRQDEFSFRLAQWLLDQLGSEGDLKTVAQQFNILIYQAQEQSIEELYAQIGRLIFQKFIQTKTSKSAQLCAQLCRSLFMAQMKKRRDHPTRPMPIHDHLFRCCLDHLSSGGFARYSGGGSTSDGADGSCTLPESEEHEPVELAFLVVELHKHGLISIAQVYDYMFQLTTRLRSENFSHILRALYTLLDNCFTCLDPNLWESELEHLRSWVDSTVSNATDSGSQEVVKFINLLDRILNGEQGPDTNLEDLGLIFKRPSTASSALPVASERDIDTCTLGDNHNSPPGLSSTVTDLGDITLSPQIQSQNERSDGASGNNQGRYMRRNGSLDSFNSLRKTSESIMVPALDAEVHHLQLERYTHSVHPFALVDSSQSERRSPRPTPIYPQQQFSSSESSFSSAGSAHVLPVPSPSPISTAVATLMLNKKQKKDRLAKVVELRIDQEKKVKEKPERVKRSKDDVVLDWLERETTARGSLERRKTFKPPSSGEAMITMETAMPRQSDFQLRLAQWLLEQLNSRGELETVTQQFGFLVSQAQEQTISDLYANIGMLIYQKVAHIRLEELRPGIRLCAELCYSLFILRFRQRSGLALRIVLIHEHIYRMCIDSLSTENTTVLATPRGENGTTAGSGAVPQQNGDEISVERISELLFHLCDFRLISLAQICEFVFRVIETHRTSTGARLVDAVAGVRLLNELFPENSPVPWKDEVELFGEWASVHSSPNEGPAQASLDHTTRSDEPRIVSEAEDNRNMIKPNSPVSLRDDDRDDVSVISNETGHALHGRVHDEEEMHNVMGNNAGKPPQTPVSSRPESPVDDLSEGKVPTGFSTGSKHEPTNSGGVATDPVASISDGTVDSEGVPRANHPDREQEGGGKGAKQREKEKAEEKKRAEEAERKAKEEADRIAREAERKAQEERRAREEAERKAKEEARRQEELQAKARAEEERKASEEAARRVEEERQAREEADRKAEETLRAQLEAERQLEEERMIREEGERKVEKERRAVEEGRRKEEELRLREAERLAKEEKKRQARELNDRRLAERKAKREAERKAREDEERRAREEEKKEVEKRAKEEEERKAQERERKEAERRARKEAERQAKEKEELETQRAQVRKLMERRASRETKLKTQEEWEHKRREEKARRELDQEAIRDAEQAATWRLACEAARLKDKEERAARAAELTKALELAAEEERKRMEMEEEEARKRIEMEEEMDRGKRFRYFDRLEGFAVARKKRGRQ